MTAMKKLFSRNFDKQGTICALEMESSELCQPLLRRNDELTYYQKLKKVLTTLTTEKTIRYMLMLCLLLSIAMIIALHYVISSKIDETNGITSEVVYDIYSFNGSEKERKQFLQEWGKAKLLLLERKKILDDIYQKHGPSNNTSSFDEWQNLLINGSKPDVSLQIQDCALILEHIKRKFKRCVSLDVIPDECKNVILPTIQREPNNRYRNIDGSCNNLANPRWGMYGASFLRCQKAHYADDVAQLRQSIYGVPLPNVRVLSNKLSSRKTLPDANTTMLLMNFGLLLDHDVVRSAPAAGVILGCCSPDVLRHPLCLEIEIEDSDDFYAPLNVSCLNFIRDGPAVGICPGLREQRNLMTSFIDGSAIYGPTLEETNRLRTFSGGKLRTSIIGNTPLLHINENSGKTCYTRNFPYKCFSSGDIRVNMHLELMTMHTIWSREHNRLTDELQKLNPTWSDEKLFQESRRIAIAELQLITYREFLPVILGNEEMEKHNLQIKENEPFDGYDETVDAGIYNVFSTAAFRFGHTLVQNNLEFRGSDQKLESKIPLHETYMNPSILYKCGMDDVTRGMASQRTHQVQPYTTKEVRGRLLQHYYENHGHDLTAMSIQRGRDHGLPSYTKWRKYCGLSGVNTWEDLYEIMTKNRVDDLREMYMSVEDIDLIPGALGEHHEKGSLLGPTYLCLISKQFENLRRGDRFWFENQNQAGSFTKEQLKEIYKTSFARVLCDTSDALMTIQKFPFLLSSHKNPVMQCTDFSGMNLSLWKEMR